ncbi:FHA domain-containing protein [Entamoeba marina]
MNITTDDQTAMKKGYCCKISYAQNSKDGLYIRPNKIYQIGNQTSAAIQVSGSSTSICTLTCDKEGNVVLEVSPQNKEVIKINNIEANRKHILYHLDIITIGNGNLHFVSFFNGGQQRLNCKNLHLLLMRRYPSLHQQLLTCQSKMNNLREYRKALREIFASLDKRDKEKIELCRNMFRDVLDIIMDSNPPAKLQLECLQNKVDTSFKLPTTQPFKDNLKSISNQQSLTTLTPIKPDQSIHVHNDKEKSLMTDMNTSFLLNFDETDTVDGFEEYRKRHSNSNSPQTKRVVDIKE